MRKLIVLAMLLAVLIIGPVSNAKSQGVMMAKRVVAGRIVADVNPDVYAAAYQDGLDQTNGNSWIAATSANLAMSRDATDRLNLAMEAFQKQDPGFFKAVMNTYGLTLVDRPK